MTSRAFTPGILIPTTVVGSFPAVPGRGLGALIDPYRHAVQFAVAEQIRAGIDIISDGQVREGMIQAFTGSLPGIRDDQVISRVGAAPGGITVKDTAYALTQAAAVKGILTGPTSLAHALRITTPGYRNREELVMDLAAALAAEARALADTGVCIIQVDEPILSTGVADLHTAVDAIKMIAENVPVPLCLHVCGPLGDIIDPLLSLPIAILDFEAATEPANLEVCSEKDLGGKMIGCGCVASADHEVEPVDLIKSRIERCIEVFGPENILVDPDCGLRMHTPEGAFAKLSRLGEAARLVRNELE
ncbi:MAG: methionine synthase [Methanocalculus sp. MSAO_Arc1]|uniref:methionine synthase n=1 Tax=Methanocalculus TaxID=71151 RepID=UPI000FF1AC8F|nr:MULTISPECIES: methionine synthase [unclassified Methanocalculus]MCP1662876.1 5-methyltetrahydropteroyltriglutamate--homocysteine methyltransferase [Methanocalculus sp. AMF5]RQD82068.1 MAG: methionine synthase [Methanocalculus sp. MSAO_Arc1]